MPNPDKTWIRCLLCAGNGIIVDVGDHPSTTICPRCNGDKVEVTSVVAKTKEVAVEAFEL